MLWIDAKHSKLHLSLSPGHCLTVSYWRELLNRGSSVDRKDPLTELGYRFSIQTDSNEASNPLKGETT